MDELDIVQHDLVPDFCRSRVLVLGCGNVLFGDDGVGPSVARRLGRRHDIPVDVCVLDAGCAVREVLCTIALSPVKPGRIIVVDAADTGRQPGEIVEETVGDMPPSGSRALSLHLLPTSSLLTELRHCCGLDVTLLTVQPEHIPDVVSPGLSRTVEAVLPQVCRRVMDSLSEPDSRRG